MKWAVYNTYVTYMQYLLSMQYTASNMNLNCFNFIICIYKYAYYVQLLECSIKRIYIGLHLFINENLHPHRQKTPFLLKGKCCFCSSRYVDFHHCVVLSPKVYPPPLTPNPYRQRFWLFYSKDEIFAPMDDDRPC